MNTTIYIEAHFSIYCNSFNRMPFPQSYINCRWSSLSMRLYMDCSDEQRTSSSRLSQVKNEKHTTFHRERERERSDCVSVRRRCGKPELSRVHFVGCSRSISRVDGCMLIFHWTVHKQKCRAAAARCSGGLNGRRQHFGWIFLSLNTTELWDENVSINEKIEISQVSRIDEYFCGKINRIKFWPNT